MGDLNAKQEQFAIEYLKDFNGTQAAIRAGYSEKTAYSQASDLLKKPEIQEFMRMSLNDAGMTKERMSKMVADALTFNYGKIVEAVEQIETTNDNRQTITTYKIDTSVIPEEVWQMLDVEFSPTKGLVIKSTKKIQLIDALSKIMGWNAPEKHDVNVLQAMTVIEEPSS